MPEDEVVQEEEQQPAETTENEEQPEATEEVATAETQEPEKVPEPEKEPEPWVPRTQFNETAYRLRKANEQLKKLQAEPVRMETAQPQQFSAPEPKWEQFENPEDYVRNHHAWATSKLEHERVVRQQVEAMAELAEARGSYGQERLREGSAKYPDFIATLDRVGLRTDRYAGIVNAFLDSENFADLAYHLATNTAELDRISQLSDASQIRELGKLEARLMATQTLKEKQKVIPTKVEGAGGGPKPKADIDPHKEFERAKQTGDWATYIRKTKSLKTA